MNPGVVVIIDGTGPLDDTEYASNFLGSFCRKVQERTSQTEYIRGVPGEEKLLSLRKTISVMFDGEVATRSRQGQAQISRTQKFHLELGAGSDGFDIFLVGHSRGGLSCVLLAEMLGERSVEAMFLFDAVNMTWPKGRGKVIPKNVKNCYHAIRNPSFFNHYWNKLKHAIAKRDAASRYSGPITVASARELNYWRGEVDRLWKCVDKTRSNRYSIANNWGNCATEWDSSHTNFEKELFWGSHGALGGTPWPPEVFPEDASCASKVGEWMWKWLDKHKVFDIGKFERAQKLRATA